MNPNKVNIGIIGCGNIAGPYAKDLATYPEVNLVGVADIDAERAAEFAREHNCHAFPGVEALLADQGIQLAVNLTTHHAHKTVTTHCLEAGKHVYSEKPLATTYEDAQALVTLADKKGLRLASSPFTLMGEAQQTAWKYIREDHLGAVRLAYAEVNWGRIESWHPAPSPFYQVGALWDVGVYPLTILTAIFGPAKNVLAYGKVLYPDRITKEGTPFRVETPDFVTAVVELENDTVVRLTTNFYVGQHNKQVGIEFHGDLGSLHISSWQRFDANVEFSKFGGEYEPIPPVRPPYQGTPWGRGVRETAQAMLEGRPHRFTGEMAAHIVEILSAAAQSIEKKSPVKINSTFTPPAPMAWAQ